MELWIEETIGCQQNIEISTSRYTVSACVHAGGGQDVIPAEAGIQKQGLRL